MVSLYPAEYVLTMEYSSDVPIEVWGEDTKYINEDNTQGTRIFEVTLPAAEKRTEAIRFTAQSRITGLQLHSEQLQKEEVLLHAAQVRSMERIYRDKEFLVILTALVCLGCFVYGRRRSFSKEEKVAHLLLLGSVVVVSWILTAEYIPFGHDINIHFSRIEGLKNGLLAGHFPVRIYPNLMNDYGYAFPVFYPDLFLYLPAVLGVFGVSTYTGYKMLIFLIHLVTAYGSWFAFSRLSKSRKTGLIAALLYVLAAYRLADVYVRGALGEAMAMAFLPLWLYGVYELIRGDYKKWIWSVIGFTCLLRSHVLSTEIAVLLTVVFAVCSLRYLLNWKRFGAILIAGVCTLGLNIGFLIPFVDHINEAYNVWEESGQCLSTTVTSSIHLFSFVGNNLFGVGAGELSVNDKYPWALGLGLVAGCICLVFSGIWNGKENLPGYRQGIKALGIGAFFVYASTKWFPWDWIYEVDLLRNLTSIIQFPWRFLGFATLFLAIAAAYGFQYLFWKTSAQEVFLAVGLGFAVLSSIVYLNQYYDQAQPAFYKNSMPVVDPLQVDDLYLLNGSGRGSYYRRENVLEAEDETVAVLFDNYQHGPLWVEFDYAAEQDVKINAPFVYDKLFQAWKDEEQQLITYIGGSGRLGVYLEAGSGHVSIAYEEPTVYLAATGLELVLLWGLLIREIYRKQRNRVSV